MWGHALCSCWDTEAMYKIDQTSMQHIFWDKLEIIKACFESWPRFASFQEDYILRKEKWKEKYKDMRLIIR